MCVRWGYLAPLSSPGTLGVNSETPQQNILFVCVLPGVWVFPLRREPRQLFVLSLTCMEQSLHGSPLRRAQPMHPGRNRFVHMKNFLQIFCRSILFAFSINLHSCQIFYVWRPSGHPSFFFVSLLLCGIWNGRVEG